MTYRRHRHDRAGFALVAVILILAMLMGLAAALTMSVNMDTALRGAFNRFTSGFYAAEGGLNSGMDSYRNIFLGFNVPSASAFNTQTVTVGNRTVNYQMTDITSYDAQGNPPEIVIPPGLLFGGLDAIQYVYIANSSAQFNTFTEASVNGEFDVGWIPVFQFIAFYKGDLEVAPGANMNLYGRMHANGDLYLDANGSTLAITDNPPAITTVQVTSQGNIYRGRKYASLCESPGTVTVDMLQDKVAPFGNLDPQNLNCNGGSTRLVPQSELATWLGSMESNIESISVPLPDNTAYGSGVYWTRADLRIVLNLTKTWTPPSAGAPQQWAIEVQNADGTQDVARTNILHTFMAAGDWNQANSSLPGTRPIFYTDQPHSGTGYPAACNCTDVNATGCTNGMATCYNPPFAGANPAATPNAAQNNRVYGTGVSMTLLTSATATAGVATATAGTAATATAAANATGTAGRKTQTAAAWTPTNTPRTGTPTVTPTPTATFTPTPSPTAVPALVDADYRRGGFYNWREQKWMYLLNINLSDLLEWNMAQAAGNQLFNPADRTDGGLVFFFTVEGGESNSPANHYGVRIFGSPTLLFPNMGSDPTGVTVVSDQAIYVQGNYNQAATMATGKQPSALMGDSINVLSQAYFSSTFPYPAAGSLVNDAQSNQGLGSGARAAATTTINTAFLGGVDVTPSGGGAGEYNGGLENYPRFQEDWGGATFNYLGSFVSLGTPLHVNGAWCGTGNACNVYNPPTRVWNYDSEFQNAVNLPPLTPRFVYVQQVLFTENFK